MRKIAANWIFPGSGPPIARGMVTIDRQGWITDIGICDDCDHPEVEWYNGIITPGFINAHCHLELSHLYRKIKQGKGLHYFITDLVSARKKNNLFRAQAMEKADRQMRRNGIVAVADIANTNAADRVKQRSEINYSTFYEVYGTDEKRADVLFDQAAALADAARSKGLDRVSVTVHAPYSVSPRLFTQVAHFAENSQMPWTIHNQESGYEDLFFKQGTGPLARMLQQLGVAAASWIPSGRSSLQTILPLLPSGVFTLLVHNTYISESDVQAVIQSGKKVCWVLVPNANLYIEKRLPDIDILLRHNQLIALGTDSLASNYSLSILDEIMTLKKYFPGIALHKLFQWATLNGAIALGIDKQFGSIEIGKRPGLNLITGWGEGLTE